MDSNRVEGKIKQAAKTGNWNVVIQILTKESQQQGVKIDWKQVFGGEGESSNVWKTIIHAFCAIGVAEIGVRIGVLGIDGHGGIEICDRGIVLALAGVGVGAHEQIGQVHVAALSDEDANVRVTGPAGERVMDLVRANIRPRDIVTRKALENAAAVVAASGGSTNAALHLPAIANVFGRVVGDVEPFYEQSRKLHSEGFKHIEIRRA